MDHPNLIAALRYAAAGIKVFPCYLMHTGNKKPLNSRWLETATSDPALVRADFTKEYYPGGNLMPIENILIGMPCGAINGFEVVDLDTKNDDGHETVPNWEQLAEVISLTPSGGHHLFFRFDPTLGLRNDAGYIVHGTTKVRMPGVDVRTNGGYVILPGSTYADGRAYVWQKSDLLDEHGKVRLLKGLNTELLVMAQMEAISAKHQRRKSRAREPIEGIEVDRTQRARTWLAKKAQEVAETPSGHREVKLNKELFHASAFVRFNLISLEELTSLFRAAALASGQEESVINEKTRHSIEDGIKKQVELPISFQEDDWLRRLNGDFFVLQNEAGKCVVGNWAWDSTSTKQEVSTQSFTDFQNAHMNQRVSIGTDAAGQAIFKPLGKAWLEHTNRRQYLCTVFAPGKGPVDEHNRLNMWNGWHVDKAKGSWRRMGRHIWKVIASKNKEHFKYIMRWCAYCMQHPDKPAGVALVLKGGQGVGKGVFAQSLIHMFGPHGVQATSTHQFAGKFNAWLRDKCMLFADEVVAPTDKSAVARLKALLTEEKLMYEGKGANPVEGVNHVKVVMASNDDWVVPVEVGNRRFAVFEVSKVHQRDRPWFAAIAKELENGGYEAMLWDLQRVTLGDWTPEQNIPQTSALEEQEESTRNPWDHQFTEWFEGKEGRVRGETIWELLAIPIQHQRQEHRGWIGASMKRLGWERKRLWVRVADGGRKLLWHYVRGDEGIKFWTKELILQSMQAQSEEAEVEHTMDEANRNGTWLLDLPRTQRQSDSDDGNTKT